MNENHHTDPNHERENEERQYLPKANILMREEDKNNCVRVENAPAAPKM